MSLESIPSKIMFGELRIAVLTDETDLNASALPLKKTMVTAQVTGPVVSVCVVQSFKNPITVPVELDYLFPLPESAAVVDFELMLGERRVKGDLQELEQARAAYDAAREAGLQAGLLEQRRPNLFSIHLANVLPGEQIQATMRYQERIRFDDGTFEFVFPMGITPKYDRLSHPGEGAGTSAPLAAAGETIGPVEINLSVDAGVPVGDPVSPSHGIQATRQDERRFQVTLAGQVIPNKDFVLRYPLASKEVSASAWTSLAKEGQVFLASLVPPTLSEDYTPLPREFIFVLDRSGSMSGEPIAQARNALRACLRSLNQNDRFRILLFDDQMDWYDLEPRSVNQDEIDRADTFLVAVEGRGGTEILGALDAVLKLPEDNHRTRYVLFLTDGAVSAEAAALDQVRRRLGKARLFTFGIGPSVNRALLNRLAVLGRGSAEFLQLNEDIEGAVIRFQDRVGFPLLRNLSLEWFNANAWDIYPTQLPDLYAGQPLILSGMIKRQADGLIRLVVHGLLGDQPVTMPLNLLEALKPDPAVVRVWARARVDDLLEQIELDPGQSAARRSEVISLALEHALVTPLTAFVAVDQNVVNARGEHKTILVAQPLPEGLELRGFVPRMSGARPPMPGQVMSPSPAAPAGSGNAFSIPMPSPVKHMLTKMSPRIAMADSASIEFDRADSKQEALPDQPQAILRWLARGQNLDGSWNGDVEKTAAALIAFGRAGHTTQTGSFRQAVRRAYEWLKKSQGTDFSVFARALALQTLAQATTLTAQQAAAAEAIAHLPAPATPLESAVSAVLLGVSLENILAPATLVTLDDLRLAGVMHLGLAVPESLRHQGDLALTWAACLG